MRTFLSRSRSLAVGLAVVAALLADAGAARAEADTFGLGTGRDGALSVTSAAGVVVNTYAPITAAIAAGASSVTVGPRVGAGATFVAGQVVMILQSQGGFAAPLVSGSGATLALTSATKTGRYELARVFSVAGNVVTLTNAAVNAYDANDTQLVSVPEYSTVQISAGAKLLARPWESATGTGGVVAFLATGTVTSAGTIDASARGFGGGLRISSGSQTGCLAEDDVPGAGGGAHKGEGLDPTAFSEVTTYVGATARHFGRGNVGNAGGGGDCFNAGGGGGGHGGAGGRGGNSNPNQDGGRVVGGRGGALASYDPATNLALGGGGGAGEDDDGVGGNGGNGGGIVWLRAGALAGTGSITAAGASGANAGPAATAVYSDGGGGGGAGGGVFAWFKGAAICAGIDARGGNGGNAQPTTPGRLYGPGGGGAGGRVRVASQGGACAVVVTAGASGTTSGGVASGATTGGAGTTTPSPAFTATTCDVTINKCGGCVTDAFCPPGKPTCVTAPGPTQGTCVGTVNPGDGGVDAGPDAGDGGDAGRDDGGKGEGGLIDDDSNVVPAEPGGASLEGGGIGCGTTGASTGSLLGLGALVGLVAIGVRRRRRERPRP